ncbi:hypothetical protein IWZ03DRAFT_359763 [Phyllosticta citriasiana]|uniref:Uncharacterized protein n=1 Tax=Phyllosticta citriasiana TaxID=595635 RepID=A0ABR1KN16_9PEZI
MLASSFRRLDGLAAQHGKRQSRCVRLPARRFFVVVVVVVVVVVRFISEGRDARTRGGREMLHVSPGRKADSPTNSASDVAAYCQADGGHENEDSTMGGSGGGMGGGNGNAATNGAMPDVCISEPIMLLEN